MKKIYLLHFCVMFVSLFLYSCRDHIMEDFRKQENKRKAETRSTSVERTSDAKFYWHKGDKVLLFPDNEKEYILYKESDEQMLFQNLKISSTPEIKKGSVDFGSPLVYVSAHKSIEKEPLKWAVVPKTTTHGNIPEILYRGDFFTDESGKSVGLSHLVYVKLKSENDFEKLKSHASQNNVWIVHKNGYMPKWYTLGIVDSQQSSLELANKLHETGEFEIVQPDILVDEDLLCTTDPNDPLFPRQWGLKNTGQHGGSGGFDIRFNQAQAITSGNPNVIVAVIDQGIERNHPDLNIHTLSYDTHSGTSPSVIRGSHGTACAGIIGAKKNNNLGVAGIAANCPLMSISNDLYMGPNLVQRLANGFNFAWRRGASVISNSWGGLAPSSILEEAISEALRNGRNGKGCVIVFASGNNNAARVSYPASAIPDILAVGAMSPCGERKSPSSCDGENWGSNYGESLDIVAPGVKIPTTDLLGAAGYSSNDYDLRFNGTSSACPHVAAVAALILSVKPELPQRAVVSAILRSATKLRAYSFGEQKIYGTWNQEVGYGLLNAVGALRYAALSNVVYFNDRIVITDTSVSGGMIFSQNVLVRNGAKLVFTAQEQITITPPFTIEGGCGFEMLF